MIRASVSVWKCHGGDKTIDGKCSNRGKPTVCSRRYSVRITETENKYTLGKLLFTFLALTGTSSNRSDAVMEVILERWRTMESNIGVAATG